MPVDPSSRRPYLLEVLLGGYVLALIYGTLYPWSGWRALRAPTLDFLFEWPRYWTWFDVLGNVALYAPLGLLASAALRRSLRFVTAVAVATLLASALSLATESLQTFVPGRVPSPLDWLTNSAGALLGALAAAALDRQRARWRSRFGAPASSAASRAAASGVVLITWWLVVQMVPQRLLFGSGDLLEPLLQWLAALGALPLDGAMQAAAPTSDRIVAIARSIRLDPAYSVLIEAMGAGTAIVSIGMIVHELFPASTPRALLTGGTIAAALVAKALAAALLLGGGQAGAWLSAGAQGGLVTGAVVLALLQSARRRSRLLIGIGAIAATVLLTNAFPVDAYHESMIERWDQGAWRNLNGLLHAMSLSWPFVAAGWCVARLAALRRFSGPIIHRRP